MAQLVGSNSLGLGKLIDGKNQFVHIMYSANADGSNMTAEIQSNTKYIGIVTSSSETPPVNPSDYSWGRFVGTSGTSSYTWIRYSPNEDGSNMTTTANEETKYIGVAITSENSAPTDYTKYSWALFKGNDGRGIEKTEVTYQKSTNGTVIPTGSWVASIPSLNDGEYLWTRTLFTYTDNTTTSTFSVSRNGVTGLGISKTDVHYQKSTSGTTAPTGTWTTTIPTVASNEYLWTRTTITYTNASTSVSYSVGKMGADGKDAQLLYLTASSQIQAFDKDNQPKTTQAITISAKLQNTSGVATFVAIPYIGNIAQTPITLGGTGNERTLLPTQWTNTQWTTIAITATLGSLTDTISVVRVKDGATGPKGDQGNQGIQGPPGPDGKPTYIHWAYAWSADGTDRFTTSYPNENLFPGSKATLTEVTWSGYEYDMTLIDLTKINYKQGDRIFYSYYADNTKGTVLLTATMFFYDSSGALITTSTLRKNVEAGAKGYAESDLIIPANAVSMRVPKIRKNAGGSGTASYSQNKLELLSKTIYTPAPSEDFANAYPIYAGTYTDSELIDSENPADYIWQRILGDEGESGSNYWINPSVNTVKKSATGEIKPTTITFTSFTKKGKEDTKEYPGRFVIHTSVDGSTWTARYTATTDSASYTYTIPTGVNFIRARVYDAGGTTVLLSDISIPIVEDVEGLEIGNRNYFSVKAWNNKPNLSSSGVPYMEVKVEPNTQYTLSTNIPKQSGTNQYDVFFFKENENVSSLLNGVAKNEPRTIVSPSTGIVKVAMRSYDLSAGYWIMLSKGNKAIDWQPALEDSNLHQAWANSSDGTIDFTRFYPNENLLLNTRTTRTISNNSGSYPTSNEIITEDGEAFVRTRRTSPTTNPTAFSIFTTIDTASIASLLAGKKVGISVMARASSNVNMPLMAKYLGTVNTPIPGDGRIDQITTSWTQIKLVVNSYPSGATAIRFNPLQVNPPTPDLSSFYLDLKNWKIEILDANQTDATVYTTPPIEDPIKAEMKYIGYSPQDSNNPKDYVWVENPKAQGTFKRWSNSLDGRVDFTGTYPNENELSNSRSPRIAPYQTSVITYQENISVPEWGATDAVKHTVSGGSHATVAGTLATGLLVDKTAAYVHSIYVKNIGTSYVRFNNNLGKAIDVYPGESKRVIFESSQNSTTDAAKQFVLYRANASVTQEFIVWHAKIEKSNDTATIWTSTPSEDLLNSMPKYVGIGNKNSNNPSDFVWNISPEYTQALTDLGLEDKVDNGSYENDKSDIWEEISNRTTEEEAAAIREMAESIKNSYEAFVSSGGQYQLDLEALEARSALLVQNLGDQLATFNFLKTYIKLGEEGLVIGADGSSMKMLLSKDKLSFTDGGQVVAYFSNQSFYINRGAIVDSLQVGQHKMVRLNSDHTVFQWVKV